MLPNDEVLFWTDQRWDSSTSSSVSSCLHEPLIFLRLTAILNDLDFVALSVRWHQPGRFSHLGWRSVSSLVLGKFDPVRVITLITASLCLWRRLSWLHLGISLMKWGSDIWQLVEKQSLKPALRRCQFVLILPLCCFLCHNMRKRNRCHWFSSIGLVGMLRVWLSILMLLVHDITNNNDIIIPVCKWVPSCIDGRSEVT